MMERTGNSANITFYGERAHGKRPPNYLWVEVLAENLKRVDGQWRTRRVPIYRGTIHRVGDGVVGAFEYEPRVRPKDGVLSPSVVARLVRQRLQEPDAA